jgi:hypothetical protein
MTDVSALDVAGRRHSPATMPGYHAGRPPRNKGMHYPADRPTVDEIVAVMRHTGDWSVAVARPGPSQLALAQAKQAPRPCFWRNALAGFARPAFVLARISISCCR